MSEIAFWSTIFLFLALFVTTIYMSLRAIPNQDNARAQANERLRQLQLGEVDGELASGEISVKTAETMRLEVERAYSRANRRLTAETSEPGPQWAIWAIVSTSIVAAFIAYWQFGIVNMPDMPYAKQVELRHPPQERAYEILKENGGLAPRPEVDAETLDLIEQLEETLENNPDEAQGWQYLARSSYTTGDFRRAYQAQQNYINLIGDQASAEDYALLAESMILAVNGYVSPEAEDALRGALRMDPSNRVARYYAGLAMIQNGEVENGRALLQKLLDDNKDDPNWSSEIQKRLAESAPAKGPSAEDVANAENMTDEERQQMIGGMVDGLKARLAEQGGTPDEWARLINALRVLGRDDEANSILEEARNKFPDDPNIQAFE